MVKKGSKIRCRSSRGMPKPESVIFDFDRAVIRCGADLDDPASGHGVARIHKRFRKTCCSLLLEPSIGGNAAAIVSHHLHVRRPERVRDQ